MRIKIEIDDACEDEIILRCSEITPEIIELQQNLSKLVTKEKQCVLFKDDTEYFIDVSQILFFETDGNHVMAHTADAVYETTMKLYELEDFLGSAFQRISKSSIVNINKIYSIKRNITASSLIEFRGTHKQIYVSRAYYKVLKNKLDEKRYSE